MIKFYYHFLMSNLLIFLVSCSDNNQDLIQYIKKVNKLKIQAVIPLPKFDFLQGFKFPEGNDRKNPFTIEHQKDLLAAHFSHPKQTLETFPLDALKFVGTLRQNKKIWGLIQQPDSRIAHVRVGEYMGQNNGRVILIENNLIKLEETINDSSGAKLKRRLVLNFAVSTVKCNSGTRI